MSELYLCCCAEFYHAHAPDCPAAKQYAECNQRIALLEKVAEAAETFRKSIKLLGRGCPAEIDAALRAAGYLED